MGKSWRLTKWAWPKASTSVIWEKGRGPTNVTASRRRQADLLPQPTLLDASANECNPDVGSVTQSFHGVDERVEPLVRAEVAGVHEREGPAQPQLSCEPVVPGRGLEDGLVGPVCREVQLSPEGYLARRSEEPCRER